MKLYHYFDRARGPFLSLTNRPMEEALAILIKRKQTHPQWVHPYPEAFLQKQYDTQAKLRALFCTRGGEPQTTAPYYLTAGPVDSMLTWYEDPSFVTLDSEDIDAGVLSFTYGDSFAIVNAGQDHCEPYYNHVYLADEIGEVIEQYGYPETVDYNTSKGQLPGDKHPWALLKYVEAHIWSTDAVSTIREKWLRENEVKA